MYIYVLRNNAHQLFMVSDFPDTTEKMYISFKTVFGCILCIFGRYTRTWNTEVFIPDCRFTCAVVILCILDMLERSWPLTTNVNY